jgi:TolB protein
MMQRGTIFLAGLAAASAVPALAAQERLFVDITEGNIAPVSIDVPAITGDTPLKTAEGEDGGAALARILQTDLASSPYFKVTATLPPKGVNNESLMAASSAQGVEALVVGRPSVGADGTLSYLCTLFDVFSGVVQASRDFRVPIRQWRRVAHQCADMVAAHMTGYPSHFDSRFVLAAPADVQTSASTKLIAFDIDGANPTLLVDNSELVAMPQFSPDNRSVLFMAYRQDIPNLMIADLETGRKTQLELPPGLPSAARFSPDAQRLVLALSHEGNTDIHEFDLATGRALRLTATLGINTNPSYSPDGNAILFESDRSGAPQIYIMRRDGTDQRRISFGDPHSSPVWSPDGGMIAFATQTSSGMKIGMMTSDGRNRRITTEGPHDENPTWAPSGRAIAFQRNFASGGTQELRWVNINGGAQHRVALPLPGSEPDWSRILP